MKITTKYQTIATYGYTAPVIEPQERRAHGGVCLIQVRRQGARIIARKINSNGRFREVGKPFTPSAEQLDNWQCSAAKQ